MKIVLASNYYNHHQSALSKSFYRLTEGRYSFVATSQMHNDRKALGYQFEDPDFVKHIPRSDDGSKEFTDFCVDVDVIIAGSIPNFMLEGVKKDNKLIFKYSERPFKTKEKLLKNLIRRVKLKYNNRLFSDLYMLCSSYYAASDYGKSGLYKGRTYKWGYFPETKKYDSVSQLMENKKSTEILWCGRFLDWKHPDDAIHVAQRLKSEGYEFNLRFIGVGDMEQTLRSMIDEYHLSDRVHLLGSMPPDSVREHMESAGIYLFTSDQTEGWGAVLNEAMNSGCAVVASHLAGSTGYLIENGENGLIYESGNIDMLYEKVKSLLDSHKKQREMGQKAYQTIIEEWNGETAAERFINLADAILRGETYPELYLSGPCSYAKVNEKIIF